MDFFRGDFSAIFGLHKSDLSTKKIGLFCISWLSVARRAFWCITLGPIASGTWRTKLRTNARTFDFYQTRTGRSVGVPKSVARNVPEDVPAHGAGEVSWCLGPLFGNFFAVPASLRNLQYTGSFRKNGNYELPIFLALSGQLTLYQWFSKPFWY